MTAPALADTTVLSNFACIQRPDLLRQAFGNLAAPPSVVAELTEGERLGRIPTCNWGWLPPVDLSPEEQAHAARLGETLGKGEAECLAAAQSRGELALSDDRDARRVAGLLGVVVSGTLGALANLVAGGVLTIAQADALLAMMKAHGYHSPIDSLGEL